MLPRAFLTADAVFVHCRAADDACIKNKQAYGERYDCRADSGHGGVIGRDSDNHWIFGRDSDAQRGENIQMSPDNHLSVQNPPEDTAMPGTRPTTLPRPKPAMERHPARDPPGMQSYDEEHNGHRARSVQRATIAPHGPLAQLAEQGTFNPKV